MDKKNQTVPAKAPSERLSFLNARDSARAAKARGPRIFVRRLMIILPAISAVVLLGLFVWPMLNPDKILKKALTKLPDVVIENLNYTNVDSKNQPYSIRAAKATRLAGAQEVFDLEKPQGELTTQEGSWVAAKSLYGRYDHDKNQLWLGGDVQIFHDKGFQFTTDELQADLGARTAWGEKPVLIQGGFGEIRGVGFRLLDGGNVVVVKGPGTALLNLHGGDGSDKPAAPH